jgi:hypothetical protein
VGVWSTEAITWTAATGPRVTPKHQHQAFQAVVGNDRRSARRELRRAPGAERQPPLPTVAGQVPTVGLLVQFDP